MQPDRIVKSGEGRDENPKCAAGRLSSAEGSGPTHGNAGAHSSKLHNKMLQHPAQQQQAPGTLHLESAQATPFTETAVGRRLWDVPEKVAPTTLTLLALRACRPSQACQSHRHAGCQASPHSKQKNFAVTQLRLDGCAPRILHINAKGVHPCTLIQSCSAAHGQRK